MVKEEEKKDYYSDPEELFMSKEQRQKINDIKVARAAAKARRKKDKTISGVNSTKNMKGKGPKNSNASDIYKRIKVGSMAGLMSSDDEVMVVDEVVKRSAPKVTITPVIGGKRPVKSLADSVPECVDISSDSEDDKKSRPPSSSSSSPRYHSSPPSSPRFVSSSSSSPYVAGSKSRDEDQISSAKDGTSRERNVDTSIDREAGIGEEAKIDSETAKESVESLRAGEKGAIQKKGLPVEKEVGSVEKDYVSVEKDDLSVEKEDGSVEKDDVSVEKDDVCGEKDDVSVEKDDVSVEKEDGSAEKDDVSVEKDYVSVEKEDVSVEKDDTSDDNENMSVEKSKFLIVIDKSANNKKLDEPEEIIDLSSDSDTPAPPQKQVKMVKLKNKNHQSIMKKLRSKK